MTNEELAMQIQAGDNSLYSSLWGQTERLIRKLAQQYYNGHKLPAGFDFEDCLQYGYIALVRSVQSYAPAKRYKLTSYLWNHLRNVIADDLHTRNGKQPVKICSYNVLLDDSEEIELIDTIADEEASEAFECVELTDTQRIVREAVERLPIDQRQVITLLYYKEQTRKQVAKLLWITEGEVTRLREKAIRSMRKDQRLRQLHQEYCRHYDRMEPPIDFYFSDAYKQVTEAIRTMQQSGKYISYGKAKAALYLAELAFLTAERQAQIHPAPPQR